jgi:hypothetical protein
MPWTRRMFKLVKLSFKKESPEKFFTLLSLEVSVATRLLMAVRNSLRTLPLVMCLESWLFCTMLQELRLSGQKVRENFGF